MPLGDTIGKTIMDEHNMVLANELGSMVTAKKGVIEAVMAKNTPTSQNIGRQCLDHLDAAALFMQQLGMYLSSIDQAAEKAVDNAVKTGTVVTSPAAEKFSGGAGG